MDSSTKTPSGTGDPARVGGAPTEPVPYGNGQPTTYIPQEVRPQNTAYTGEPTRAYGTPATTSTSPGTQKAGGGWSARPQDMTGPVILIAIGLIFLLTNFGWLGGNIWGQIWRLWPLFLIGIGLNIVLARRSPGASSTIWLVVIGLGVLILLTGGYAGTAWGGIGVLGILALAILGIAAWSYFSGNRIWGASSAPVGPYGSTPTQPTRAGGEVGSGGQPPAGMLESSLTVPLAGATSGDVRVDFGAGTVEMGSTGGETADLARANFRYYEGWGEPVYTSEMAGTTLNLRLSQKPGSGPWNNWGGQWESPRWNIGLNPRVPTRLTVKTGASKATIDLERLSVSHLDLDLGASDTNVTMPAAGMTTAKVNGGAMSLQIFIPASVAARIRTRAGLASINVDPRFRRVDDIYISDNYDTSPNRLDLDIEVGVSSVNIRTK